MKRSTGSEAPRARTSGGRAVPAKDPFALGITLTPCKPIAGGNLPIKQGVLYLRGLETGPAGSTLGDMYKKDFVLVRGHEGPPALPHQVYTGFQPDQVPDHVALDEDALLEFSLDLARRPGDTGLPDTIHVICKRPATGPARCRIVEALEIPLTAVATGDRRRYVGHAPWRDGLIEFFLSLDRRYVFFSAGLKRMGSGRRTPPGRSSGGSARGE